MSGLSSLNTFENADDRATAYAAWATRLKAKAEAQRAPEVPTAVVSRSGDEPIDWSSEALFAHHD